MARTETDSYPATRWGLRIGIAASGLSLAMVSAMVSPVAANAAPTADTSAASLSSSKWGDARADRVAKDARGKNAPAADPGSLYTIEKAIGARKVWQQTDSANRQVTGQGVTVALLDSGTAPVAGLSDPGKLTYGPDLSIEGNGVLIDQDTYGHGTHLAGIIAARDSAALTARTIPALDPSVQLGVAPDADLLTLKLATTDGSTDVSQVIAALNWITEHQTSQDGSKVRVVNLSFGTDSLQPYQLDPLAAAAENAWRHGLVVVVSGGNGGQYAGRLTDPAIDPYVLAVGASDGADSVAGWNKPVVASFSSSGTAQRHVDLLAPGTSIVSLRDPGSFVDVNHPEGLVSGDTTGRMFRGSGTSQAAAVVSGAVALLLQAHPELTPDQVKAALVGTATPVAASAIRAGAGQLDISAALNAVENAGDGGVRSTNALKAKVVQSFPISTGQGSIQAARGGDILVDPIGLPIMGEVDIQGNRWNPTAWWAASSTLTSWSGGMWMGATWTGSGWEISADGLLSNRWNSNRWNSNRWNSAVWDAMSWSSNRWNSDRWSALQWVALLWSATAWA
jgi:serine protease AprX